MTERDYVIAKSSAYVTCAAIALRKAMDFYEPGGIYSKKISSALISTLEAESFFLERINIEEEGVSNGMHH